MNTYETLFIINPEIGDGEITKTIDFIQDVITSGGGTILKLDKWGKRQLAYEIQRKREGYYVLLYFQASPNALVELNRRFKLTDAILRNLVLQLDKEQIATLLQSIEAEANTATAASSAVAEDVQEEVQSAATTTALDEPVAATTTALDEPEIETEDE